MKLLDFGIAKLLDRGAEAATLTQTGLRALTPEYASPEQLRGEQPDPALPIVCITGYAATSTPSC